MLKRKVVRFNALVLTFDDGPGSRLTPAVLDALAESGAKATFFLLGRNLSGREHIVRQIAKQGHEICSHGYEHLHYWKVSPIRAMRDIKRGWQAIDAALGLENTKYIFRPPYGKLNVFCLLYLWIHRIPIVYWSIDMRDTIVPRSDPRRLAFLAKKAGGAVTLAHIFDRSDQGVNESVIQSTRLALKMAKESGMQVLTVSELLHKRKQLSSS